MSNVAVIEPKAEQAPRLPTIMAGGAVRAIVPQDFDSAWRIANAVCKAQMAPRGLETPEKAMVAIMHGLEIGLTPMNALQSIAVVNGRPTIWGDGAIGLARGSGLLEWMEEKFEGKEYDDTYRAVCIVKRKGEPKPLTGTFSVADAKKAGLWGKQGPWQQYPKRMLQMRARAFILRDGFADVLKGLAIKEEVEDYAARDVTVREEPPAPPPLNAVETQTTEAIASAGVTIEATAEPVSEKQTEEAIAPVVSDAPNPHDDPEAFRKWVDGVLAAVNDPEQLDAVWDAKIGPFEKQLFPPDWEDLLALHKKHEGRLGLD